jgi:hypothetical protein
VCVCVCVCVCDLGLCAILVFPRFFVCCDLCSGCVIYCHLGSTCFKGLCVCVRARARAHAQVGCSVVCN